MALVRKSIGRVPVYRGEFSNGKEYYLYNIVSYMGSSFVSTIERNDGVPCKEVDGILVLADGWEFLSDASFGVKLINEREEDIEKSVFEAKKLNGELDPNKRYFIYEE